MSTKAMIAAAATMNRACLLPVRVFFTARSTETGSVFRVVISKCFLTLERMFDELGAYWLEVDRSSGTSDTNLSEIEQAALSEYLEEKFPERSFSESIRSGDTESIEEALRERVRQELLEDSFLILGEPPASASDQVEWALWISDLSNFAANVGLGAKYYYPDGPVVSHGAEITGYFSVGIDPDRYDQEIVDDIYSIISEKAAEHDVDVPVLFRFSGPPELQSKAP
ncbi:MAG: hypothetical protein FH749_04555 [Firmicutes bacterium]|nr:hypothetical protein [Bacillota bacterium]